MQRLRSSKSATDEFCRTIAEGLSHPLACARAGISVGTGYGWKKRADVKARIKVLQEAYEASQASPAALAPTKPAPAGDGTTPAPTTLFPVSIEDIKDCTRPYYQAQLQELLAQAQRKGDLRMQAEALRLIGEFKGYTNQPKSPAGRPSKKQAEKKAESRIRQAEQEDFDNEGPGPMSIDELHALTSKLDKVGDE